MRLGRVRSRNPELQSVCVGDAQGIGAPTRSLLWLWSWIGFALVMLTALAGMTGPDRASPAPLAPMVDVVTAVDGSVDPSLTHDGDSIPSSEHEPGVLEPESDEDAPDVLLVAAATAPASTYPQPSRLCDHVRLDTGRPSVHPALARGPPTAG